MVSRQEQDVPLGALEQYLRGVRSTKPLLDEEEAGLLHCIEQGRVEQAKCIPDAYILRIEEQARTE